MKIVINTENLIGKGISVDDVIAYLVVNRDINLVKRCEHLEKLDILTRKTKKRRQYFAPSDNGVEYMDALLQNMGSDIEEADTNDEKRKSFFADLDDIASGLKEIFPKGNKMPGTPWCESTKLIAKRLRDFYRRFEVKYTKEEILDAARRYVKDNQGNKYMRTLKYFIFKVNRENGSEDETSDLMTYIENKGEESNNSYSTGEWTSELR